MVIKEIKSFALTKKFLLKEVFPKYPDIANQIKADALLRYKRIIHKPLVILDYKRFRLNIERKR